MKCAYEFHKFQIYCATPADENCDLANVKLKVKRIFVKLT